MSISITQNINQSLMSRAWYNHALLMLCILSFFATDTLHAQIHYVSKSGSNTPPYISWNTAAHKIQDAINASNRGDTVLVGIGVYYDSVRINKRIHLMGENLDETIIRGDSVFDGTPIRASDTCSIEGFNIIPNSDSMSTRTAAGIYSDQPINIINCKIKNAYWGIVIFRYSFTISNVILNNIIVGVYLSFHTPQEVGRLTNANVSVREINSVFQWSPRAATWVDYGSFHIDGLTAINMKPRVAGADNGVFNNSLLLSGSIVNSSLSNFWSRCIVVSARPNYQYSMENCVMNGGDYGVYMVGRNLVMHNTILMNNEIAVNTYQNYTGDYNLYFNNETISTGSTFYQGEHDIIADPMFVNATAYTPPPTTEYDYHLQYGSPAIDAGVPWLLDADGSRSDIGVYGGPGGSSYPYQDLPPLAPKWISSKVENKTVTLKWKKNGESDYLKSYLHRSTVQGYTPDSTTIIAVLDGSTLHDTAIYTDTLPSYAIPYYYRLQSEDSTGHLGNPSNAMAVTAVSIRENSTTELFDYRLEQNYPNPFNATTMIPFSLKEEGSVTISLYTTTGEKVATLASSHYAKGSYEISADLGHLASGIYLYRIEVHNGNRLPVFRDMRKLVLVK